MKPDYIKAYQLMAEFAAINKMPDSVAKAVRWHTWSLAAIEWEKNAKPLRGHLQLVQSTCHLLPQNRDVTSQPASKTEYQV